MWNFAELILQKYYLTYMLFLRNEVRNHAGAVAYYFLLSIVPILLIFLYLFDTVLNNYPFVSENFYKLASLINENLTPQFFENLGLNTSVAKTFGIFGLLSMLWSSRLIMSSVQRAFDIIFVSRQRRNFFLFNLISLVFVPAVFVLVLLASALNLIFTYLGSFLTDYGVKAAGLIFLNAAGSIVPVLILFVTIFAAYALLPRRRPGVKASFFAALYFIVAFLLLKFFFSGIISSVNFNLAYGIIGSLVILLIWVYLVCLLFFFYAEYAYVTENTDVLVMDKIFSHQMDQSKIVEEYLFNKSRRIIDAYSRFYHKGEKIFSQGDEPDKIYYVKEGHVDIIKNEDGEDVKVGRIDAGNVFGEMGYLLEQNRTADAVCAEDTSVLEITPEIFEELMAINSSLSRKVIETLSGRLNETNKKLALNSGN